MISPLQTSQIAERIATAVRQAGGGTQRLPADVIARGELPPVPEPVAPPIFPSDQPAARANGQAPEFPLDEAASMLPRARAKITVNESVPGFLRPLYRNQGGYNHILLETLERLVEVNRQLQRQNQLLQAKLLSVQGWMESAAHTSLLDHDWMLAVENRLRGVTGERLEQLEAKLAKLEGEGSGSEGKQEEGNR